MLTAYIMAAMRCARYEILDDQPNSPHYGELPNLQRVLTVGATPVECQEELQFRRSTTLT